MYLVCLNNLPKIQCLYVRNIPDYDLRKPLLQKEKDKFISYENVYVSLWY